jgi:hypothetical protein
VFVPGKPGAYSRAEELIGSGLIHKH